ncbi:MAG: hypothetical protein WD049_06750 [Candidatus Paceibacterota bacterium]
MTAAIATASKHDAIGCNHQRMLDEMAKSADAMRVDTSCSTQQALQDDYQSFFNELLNELSPSGEYEPHELMRRGLSAFSKVEAKAFVLTNLMEAVKSGKSLTDTMVQYHKIGLTDIPPESLQPTADGTQPKNGTFLRGLWKTLKAVAGTIVGIIANACKTGAQMTGVTPIIGVAAGFPTISFEIGPKATDVNQIWQNIRAAFASGT